MNSSAITVCSVVCAGCLVYLFARICRTFARGSGLRGFSKLPGPRGWPLLGYLRSIESPAWVTYRQWSDELRRTYGLDIQDHDDPYIAAAERGGQIASACMIPGSYLVDLVPILKYVPEWFPGAGFKRQAREWRKEVEHTINAPFAAIKTRGDLTPDCAAKPLLDRLLDSSDDPAYAEYVLKGALATSYIVGVDTVASTLETFFLSMTLHPEVLREAQCAVDRVCAGRLPNFSDYDVLPWIHAIVKECLRWRPAIPMNFAHRLTKDDVYEGYHIPQGALVLANNWAILHDPEAYPDPEAFNPRRFFRACPGAGSGDVKLDPMVRDPALAAFGFGRRICPGRHMAYESIWLAIASVIAVFDVTKAVDAHGKVVEPSGEYTDGFLSAPKPFRCKLSPRSRAYAALVHAALE